MSKVKIQGNASGTGIFTVAAPATNTDRTLTLPDTSSTLLAPDSTGSIQLDFAGSNNYLRFISSSNYVGRNSSTGDIWLNAQGGQSVILGINDTTQLKVDGNGRVSMPSQPAFQAYRDAGHVTNNQVIVFNGVRFNIGSCYSNSTGRFTAPIAGRYQFNTHTMLVNGTGGDHQISFRVNGGNYSTLNPGNGTFNVAFGLSEVIQLAAGDYVDVYYYDSQSNSIYGSGGANWTGFSGHLIG